MHNDIIPLTAYTIVLCLVGCIWAHATLKKYLSMFVIIPAVVFGFAPLLHFAIAFLLVFVAYFLSLIGIDIEKLFPFIAFAIKAVLIGVMAWTHFSDLRMNYLIKAKKSQPERRAYRDNAR